MSKSQLEVFDSFHWVLRFSDFVGQSKKSVMSSVNLTSEVSCFINTVELTSSVNNMTPLLKLFTRSVLQPNWCLRSCSRVVTFGQNIIKILKDSFSNCYYR